MIAATVVGISASAAAGPTLAAEAAPERPAPTLIRYPDPSLGTAAPPRATAEASLPQRFVR